MCKICKGEEVFLNHFITPIASRPLEVDIFVPSRALAFEYNGEYHYQFVTVYLVNENQVCSFFIFSALLKK